VHQAIAEVDPVFAVNAVYVYEQVPPIAFMSSCLARAVRNWKFQERELKHMQSFDQFFNISVDGWLFGSQNRFLLNL
jgi:hypothetical protein